MLKLLVWNCEPAGCDPFRQSGTRPFSPRGFRELLEGIFLICVLASCALAQSTTGSIGGTVMDPSGAVIPNAAITVTDLGTNIETKTTTDQNGSYVITPLPIGLYSVAVEAKGFKKFVASGIQLNVQDRLRVDATLQLGQGAETVSVEAAAPLLETGTST